jgi:hypothetical protein
MSLNETYSKVCISKQFYDAFHIQNGLKQGYTLLPLLLNVALEYTTGKVKENLERSELTGPFSFWSTLRV